MKVTTNRGRGGARDYLTFEPRLWEDGSRTETRASEEEARLLQEQEMSDWIDVVRLLVAVEDLTKGQEARVLARHALLRERPGTVAHHLLHGHRRRRGQRRPLFSECSTTHSPPRAASGVASPPVPKLCVFSSSVFSERAAPSDCEYGTLEPPLRPAA